MYPSVRAMWETFNRPFEGRVPFMYLDVKGLVSTGVGNLIDASKPRIPLSPFSPPSGDVRKASIDLASFYSWTNPDGSVASRDQVAAAWDAVKARVDLAPLGGGHFDSVTNLRITDAEIDRGVFAKVDQMEASLKRRSDFAGFDSWPADAQLGVLSMSWGMGPAFNFPKFQAAARAGDWATASAQCRFNPEIGTIVKRNDADQKLFLNAARVVADGLAVDALLGASAPAPAPDPSPEPEQGASTGQFESGQVDSGDPTVAGQPNGGRTGEPVDDSTPVNETTPGDETIPLNETAPVADSTTVDDSKPKDDTNANTESGTDPSPDAGDTSDASDPGDSSDSSDSADTFGAAPPSDAGSVTTQ